MKRSLTLLAGLLSLSVASSLFAGQLGFEEDFALAPDRAATLNQLIPGTEDAYYYTCLYYQGIADFKKADDTLAAWTKRHGNTTRVEEMRNRQALLKYATDNKGSLDFINWRLGLTFSQQRQNAADQQQLPSTLDPGQISSKTLTQRALNNYTDTLQSFENSAFELLPDTTITSLSEARRHELLARLTLPDFPGLLALINKDLSSQRYNTGFGSLAIHNALTLEQLDALLKLRPGLLNETNFVNIYLTRLKPANDVDWKHAPASQQAYLDRLWTFVSRLGPVHNSLKAHVLYTRLAFDRTQNVYDRERFLAYLNLPRRTVYVQPHFFDLPAHYNYPVDLNATFTPIAFPCIGNDEPLVRSYLMHFFLEDKDTADFKTTVEENYLKETFAETKIVNGLGDPETWYPMLTPEKCQALKDRIDLDFAPTNPFFYQPDDAVALDVTIKNVPTLIVKVFQINTVNYYRTHQKEIDTDIDLDGLVANEEKAYSYNDAPLHRHAEHFAFPTLSSRGVYVVEFIGNGKASRALVRKGHLRFLQHTTSAGQLFTIYDESNNPLPNATLWVEGHEFSAEKPATRPATTTAPATTLSTQHSELSTIVVPFSTNPGRQPFAITVGDFATLEYFDHQAEHYTLAAGIYVPRESLLKNKTAKVILRPTLLVNSVLTTSSLLEEPTLVITSVDNDGTPTTTQVPNIPLFDDKESTYEFVVPERLAMITFTLRGKVQNLSTGKKDELVANAPFLLNAIDKTQRTDDLHFSHINGQYFIDVLGKTGEPLPNRPVYLNIKHRDFKEFVSVTLRSDPNGRIALGTLDSIATLTATANDGVPHIWSPAQGMVRPAPALQGAVGQTLQVPYVGQAKEPTHTAFALFELRDSTPFADRFANLSLQDGFLTLHDLPAGDYALTLKETNTTIPVRISAGTRDAGWLLSENRLLESKYTHPLHITSLSADADSVKIQLANNTQWTRVHVFATRFAPDYDPYLGLAAPQPGLSSLGLPKADSVFLTGRNIGDEYRYIIERKYAAKFPGNMLTRPGLILNPWSLSKTETANQAARAGELPAAISNSLKSLADSYPDVLSYDARLAGNQSNLDFLAAPALQLTNLHPDASGLITIPRKDLGAHQQIHVVAVDPVTTVYRELSLPEVVAAPRDLRMADALDPAKHFTEQKQVTILHAGETLTIPVAATSNLQMYDDLTKLYKLFAALHQNDPNFAEFSFILDWPKLSPADKRAKYSKYASHELSFFLYKKDPQFFKVVILPYLKNKKDKTFLDHYLLNDDLATYEQPWSYGQLNIAEQALLAQRIDTEQSRAARHIKDRFDLLPPDLERESYLFLTALKAGSLEADLKKSGSGLLILNGANAYTGATTLSGGTLQDGARPGFEVTHNELFDPLAVPVPVMQPARDFAAGDANGSLMGLVARGQETPKSLMAKSDPAASDRKDITKADLVERAEKRAEQDVEVDELQQAKSESSTADGPGNQPIGSGRISLGRRRAQVHQFYRKLDTTEEFVENNYYHLPIQTQNADLITVNAFWKDFAAWNALPANAASPFLSPNIAQASRNFPEILLALALTDLPFDAAKHKTEIGVKDRSYTITAASPIILFHKEIHEAPPLPAPAAAEKTPILLSQNYFRYDDRYTFIDNERADKYISDEFLTHVVYGCQVVVTNPTSSRQKLDVLLQLPQGSLPVLNAQQTQGIHVDLAPYESRSLEYAFYFPAPGSFTHYPTQVAKNEKFVASAPVVGALKVVESPSKVDTASWDYISQNSTPAEVLTYLKNNNLDRLNLDLIAWRMRDADFFKSVLAILDNRHVYNHTLYSFGLHHNDVPTAREFLQHDSYFTTQSGSTLASPLLTLAPVARKTYQLMEYAPLVNARAHKLGQTRQILNDRLFQQYQALLTVLRYQSKLSDDDLMAVTYYLLLQDRIEDAGKFFAQVNPKNLATTLQYDYFTVYMDLFTDKPTLARTIAAKYKDYPIDRWRNLFNSALAQLDEIDGKSTTIVDKDDRNQQQTALAAGNPNFEMKVDGRKVTLTYQNISSCQVHYYLMDLELMFSQNPFLQQFTGQFSAIKPNQTTALALAPKTPATTFDLPEQFRNSNVMIEVTVAGQTRAAPCYANSLSVSLVENYGQLQVTSEKTADHKPLPKVYVKVYARLKNGATQFYKDGYTDLRGRFDYSSLSTNELDNVDRFALLILSDTDGALVREAAPPKR